MFNDGDEWKVQRRFTLKTLKDFGFGKASLESLLLDEANRINDHLKLGAGKPFQVQNFFNIVILNILWKIVAGER